MMTNGDAISSGDMLSREGDKSQQQLLFQKPTNGKPNMMTNPKLQGEGGCTHCGSTKHTEKHTSN